MRGDGTLIDFGGGVVDCSDDEIVWLRNVLSDDATVSEFVP